jgi:dUTP pyrophosphatase
MSNCFCTAAAQGLLKPNAVHYVCSCCSFGYKFVPNPKQEEKRVLFKKLHEDAIIPKKQREGDAAYDLHAAFGGIVHSGARLAIRTNIACAIPQGYVGLIKGRSGLALKDGIQVLGGVIDSNYRGEIVVILHNTCSHTFHFKTGDRIAQLLVIPIHTLGEEVVDELPDTSRGSQGFGSSGV